MGDVPANMPHRQRAAPTGKPAARPARIPTKRWGDAPHYAALDLGTNNCRLLIARPQGNGFAVVDAFSRIVRLGEGLASSGRLSDAAIDRTIAALRICADKLRRRNVLVARSVATEACRQAANGAEFIERAYRETGIRLDIISPEEEARLAVLGCHALMEPGDGPALIFDIGGGSTELVLIDLSGRPGLTFEVPFTRAMIGTFDVDLAHEFFQGFVNHALVTLHIDNLRGDNAHHQCETVFKAFGRALRAACALDPRAGAAIPSTKGTL